MRRTFRETSSSWIIEINLMSENARLLRFPERFRPLSLEPAEAEASAAAYLAAVPGDRTPELASVALGHPDVLFAICAKLRRLLNTSPATVVSEAVAAYEWIRQFSGKVGLFDEPDYFIGETAFLAGEASRQLGRRAEASRWLDRAEAGYRHTVNSAPGLANVAYARLSIRFEMAEYEEVVELAPSLRVSYERMAMEREQAKCCLLEAAALKQCGRLDEALKVLLAAVKLKSLAQERSLHARILAEMGDVNQLEGRIDVAIGLFQAASSLLEGSELSSSRAELKMFAGAAYWGSGQFAAAAEALRLAQADFRELNMASRVAYVSVFLADALLKIGRPREAEWEILQVLPTIEEQKMVPEGFAAVALLRESVRQRKADPNALRELREHLQKQN